MRTKKKDIRKNKINSNDKKRNKSKTKNKRKKNKQKGGALMSSIGIGLAATAVAATAYKGFRLINKIKDKSYILKLLNQDYIEYSPKVVVVETKDFMNHYLQCVGTLEFFQILLSRPEYLTSKTLRSIIKDTTNKETLDKKSLDNDFSSEYSEIEKILMTMNAKNDDITSKFELRPNIIETNKDENITELKDLLLLTARIPGSGIDDIKHDDNSKLEKITPYLTVSTFKWQDIIISGIYDEYFNSSVMEILNERDVTTTLDKEDMERIQSVIEDLSENKNFMEAIRQKMVECSSKPRGYLDFVSSNITWDSQKSCLSCPQEDCLIYVYDFYYDFLKEDIPDISILDKLYCLMICEARICVLSKCLALEAIRLEDKNDSKVRQLVHNIYVKDKESPLNMITNKSMNSQIGGGAAADPLGADPLGTDPLGDDPLGNDPLDKDPLGNDPLDKDPLDKDPLGKDPLGKDPLGSDPLGKDPLGSDPLGKDPLGSDPLGSDPLGTDPLGKDPLGKDPLDKDPLGETKDSLGSDIDKTDDKSVSNTKDTPKMDESGEEPKNTLIYGDNGEVTNPLIAEYNGYIKEELIVSLKTKKHELCKFFDVSEETNDEKLVQMYLNYKVYDELTMSELLVGLFKPYSRISNDNEKENLSSFISMMFNFIGRKGMLLFDMLGLKFLLKPGILFKSIKSLKNEDELAIAVKDLYTSDYKDHSLLLLLILLIIAEKYDNKKSPCKENMHISSILNKLNDEICEYLLTNLFAGDLELLNSENKELLKRRIFIIYRSASENVKRNLRRVDILPFDEEDDMCEMNPPMPTRIRKTKTFKRKSGQRNMRCIEKENEIMDKIRRGEKVVVDSTLINVLERCSKNDIIIEDKDGESIFGTDLMEEESEDKNENVLTEEEKIEKEVTLNEVGKLFELERTSGEEKLKDETVQKDLSQTEETIKENPEQTVEESFGNIDDTEESKDEESGGFFDRLFKKDDVEEKDVSNQGMSNQGMSNQGNYQNTYDRQNKQNDNSSSGRIFRKVGSGIGSGIGSGLSGISSIMDDRKEKKKIESENETLLKYELEEWYSENQREPNEVEYIKLSRQYDIDQSKIKKIMNEIMNEGSDVSKLDKFKSMFERTDEKSDDKQNISQGVGDVEDFVSSSGVRSVDDKGKLSENQSDKESSDNVDSSSVVAVAGSSPPNPESVPKSTSVDSSLSANPESVPEPKGVVQSRKLEGFVDEPDDNKF